MVGSRRYNIQKYQELVNNYLNQGSTELGDLTLTGDELLDFVESFEYLKEDYLEVKAEKEEIRDLSKDLIKKIETLFRRKKGSFVDELKMHLDYTKEKLE